MRPPRRFRKTREGRALAERYLRDGIAAMPDAALADVAPALFSAWERRQSARAIAGASLSAAAHAAGFADAAHLTRTSRRMFGFPPSAMRMTGPPPSSSGGWLPHALPRHPTPRATEPLDGGA